MRARSEDLRKQEVEAYRAIAKQIGSMYVPLTKLLSYVQGAVKDGTMTKEFAQAMFSGDLKYTIGCLQRIDEFLTSKDETDVDQT